MDMLGDPYETGTPKYSTAESIYDALCKVSQNDEASILSEMFADISYDGQDYYYTDKGHELKEKFEELSDYGDKMWVMDLAVFQVDNGEVHDLVFEALQNDDLAKRLGFKKLFVEHMLDGDKAMYDSVASDYYDALAELDWFDFYEMATAFSRVMAAHGRQIYRSPYGAFCSALYDKAQKLHLQQETQLIVESRAFVASYDDFMFGLRANQHLNTTLESQYKNKLAQLQAAYKHQLALLLAAAKEQGVNLMLDAQLEALPASTEKAPDAAATAIERKRK